MPAKRPAASRKGTARNKSSSPEDVPEETAGSSEPGTGSSAQSGSRTQTGSSAQTGVDSFGSDDPETSAARGREGSTIVSERSDSGPDSEVDDGDETHLDLSPVEDDEYDAAEPAGTPGEDAASAGEVGVAGTTGSAVVAPPRSAGEERPARVQPVARTRRAHLRLTHVDPWSVMKTSFLLSIAFGIVCVVAVAIIWAVLGAAGVWDSVNTMVQDTVGSDSSTPFDVTNYVGTSRVVGFTMIAAVIDVILITAVATLGAFVYNLAATLLGGVEVTLTEDR